MIYEIEGDYDDDDDDGGGDDDDDNNKDYSKLLHITRLNNKCL